MNTLTLPRLTSGGIELDPSPEAFGWLRDSSDALGDVGELRRRMDEEGYLFLPGFLDRGEVVAVRHAICDRLAEEGLLDPDAPREDAVAREGLRMAFRPDLANEGPARPLLERAIYGDRVMDFYAAFLGGPARHFDYTWLRVVAPGPGTYPHTDVVFMGRGTKNLYTAWTPLGDVPLEVGGLVLIEGSHRDAEIRETYSALDVDTACLREDGSGGGPNPLARAGLRRGGLAEPRPRGGARADGGAPPHVPRVPHGRPAHLLDLHRPRLLGQWVETDPHELGLALPARERPGGRALGRRGPAGTRRGFGEGPHLLTGAPRRNVRIQLLVME